MIFTLLFKGKIMEYYILFTVSEYSHKVLSRIEKSNDRIYAQIILATDKSSKGFKKDTQKIKDYIKVIKSKNITVYKHNFDTKTVYNAALERENKAIDGMTTSDIIKTIQVGFSLNDLDLNNTL